MIDHIKTVLRQWFTGKDNQSYEIMRALTALSVIIMLFYIGWHLMVNRQFDAVSAAGGLGALLFGGGAGAAVKDSGIGTKTKIDAGPDGTVNVGEGA
jgi:hypothetical protein